MKSNSESKATKISKSKEAAEEEKDINETKPDYKVIISGSGHQSMVHDMIEKLSKAEVPLIKPPADLSPLKSTEFLAGGADPYFRFRPIVSDIKPINGIVEFSIKKSK